MSTTATMLAWPASDLPRIFGTHEALAACAEHAGSRARHRKPTRREIRRAIVETAVMASAADRAAEARRDAEWARLVKAVSA